MTYTDMDMTMYRDAVDYFISCGAEEAWEGRHAVLIEEGAALNGGQ